MKEQVYTYNLKNKNKVFAQDREKFYSRQITNYKETGETLEAVEVIQVFIVNSEGEILIQKRGKSKRHNPGLLDKSLGGHMEFGDDPDYSVMIETVEELRTPSVVLKNPVDFEKTRVIFKKYADNIALIKEHATGFFSLERIIDGEVVPIVNKVHVYFGHYDGATKPADREASGIMYYEIDDLKKELKENPEKFTYDLAFYMQRYEQDLRDFIEYIKD